MNGTMHECALVCLCTGDEQDKVEAGDLVVITSAEESLEEALLKQQQHIDNSSRSRFRSKSGDAEVPEAGLGVGTGRDAALSALNPALYAEAVRSAVRIHGADDSDTGVDAEQSGARGGACSMLILYSTIA